LSVDRPEHELEDAARSELGRLYADSFSGPRPGVEQRILTRLDYGPRRAVRGLRLTAAVAILLAALIFTGLMSTRLMHLPGRAAGSAAPHTSPTPAASPLATPVTVAIPSSPPSPLGTASLPCRLPIDRGGKGAFMTIPANATHSRPGPTAQASDDPNGRPKLPDGEDPVNVSYSWGLARWLPVTRTWVADDGSHYAYVDRAGALHVMDAQSGQDRMLNQDHAWAVIGFEPEGIYAAMAAAGSPLANGLWLIDPNTGRAQQLQSSGAWLFVDGGVAWSLTNTQPAGPPAWTQPYGVHGNTLIRLDVRTGRTVTMYSSPTDMRMIGLDSQGNPYITQVMGGPTDLLEVTGQGRVVSTDSGYWVNAETGAGVTWFGENYAATVWLRDSAGFQLMAYAAVFGQIRIAGGCH
jgi:hypothetical protein